MFERKAAVISDIIIRNFQIKMEPPIYHSIITAYGKAGDAASACYVFDKMIASSSLSRNLSSWSVILTALSKASAKDPNVVIDCKSSTASQLIFDIDVTNQKPFGGKDFIDIVHGLTPPEAAKAILDLMNEAKEDGEISDIVLRPNSMAYCLVASALSRADGVGHEDAMNLFNDAVENGLSTDGRVLNAIIRCYGDDISEALNAWKTVYRRAAMVPDKRDHPSTSFRFSRQGKNLISAYHGLLYVAGNAYRPDIALQVVYAMAKEGVEPTEKALNNYNAGARTRSEHLSKVLLHGQYEELLLVECTKYDSNDRRRSSERSVRIIM